MSRGVVLTAAQPGNNNAVVVGMEADTGKGRCIRLFAPLVARIVRCLSNPGTDDPCTARTATLQIEDKIGSGGLLCLWGHVKDLWRELWVGGVDVNITCVIWLHLYKMGNSSALKVF